MKEALASTDSDLLDRLALTGFCALVSGGRLSNEKYRSLLFELVGEKHLLCGLGKENGDSVFNRAFSVFALEELISYNRALNRMLLRDDEVRNVLTAVLKCVKEEKDLRDFVEIKGWAHAVAHAADTLGSLAEDSAMGHNELLEILTVVKDKISIDFHNYSSDESIRLAGAVMKIL